MEAKTKKTLVRVGIGVAVLGALAATYAFVIKPRMKGKEGKPEEKKEEGGAGRTATQSQQTTTTTSTQQQPPPRTVGGAVPMPVPNVAVGTKVPKTT